MSYLNAAPTLMISVFLDVSLLLFMWVWDRQETSGSEFKKILDFRRFPVLFVARFEFEFLKFGNLL